ncbi:Hypothetical predicted protein, partial [Mytilus galloprovincialis]
REKKLNTGINPMTQRKIKLQERQLKLTILHAAKMLQDFYPKKIFPRKALFSEEDFWEDEQLKFRDWRGISNFKFKLFSSLNVFCHLPSLINLIANKFQQTKMVKILKYHGSAGSKYFVHNFGHFEMSK